MIHGVGIILGNPMGQKSPEDGIVEFEAVAGNKVVAGCRRSLQHCIASIGVLNDGIPRSVMRSQEGKFMFAIDDADFTRVVDVADKS